jgi:8-oxo-dGTP diphosphatase
MVSFFRARNQDEMTHSQKKLTFHPTSVLGVTVENRELGRHIAELRYDKLSEVLEGMSSELERQSQSDRKRGRPQLAALIGEAKYTLDRANETVIKMFRLSQPYMTHEFETVHTNKNISELAHRGDARTCTSAAIIRDGKILLGLRHYTPKQWKTVSVWTTPGGRCDEGESLEEGLRREIREETGITDVIIRQFLGVVPAAGSEADTLWVFLCTSNSEAKLMEPEKFSEWKWFPLTEIPENFINPAALKLIIEKVGF